ncbi:S-adenosyl-L-methionine-dependent methyltransferase [Pleurotus eryngii]|uniref:DNA (cytosine-5)-methyltransferase n=1 Tax=Pleurotus eryngii TaxID=5323 RepID=A0A9P6D924_PLEER|nr:S-adenosyl-L-methionine-dependent methyltransferase [Pleurotus eryngii]
MVLSDSPRRKSYKRVLSSPDESDAGTESKRTRLSSEVTIVAFPEKTIMKQVLRVSPTASESFIQPNAFEAFEETIPATDDDADIPRQVKTSGTLSRVRRRRVLFSPNTSTSDGDEDERSAKRARLDPVTDSTPSEKYNALRASPTVSEFEASGSRHTRTPRLTREDTSKGTGVDEDDALRIEGETPPDEYDSGSDDDIPIRVLTNFCIYEGSHPGDLVVPDPLLVEPFPEGIFRASGNVRAYIEPDSDEDDDESCAAAITTVGPMVRLSSILEFSFHDYKNRAFNRQLYIRTQFAWYILEEPSPTYLPLYTDFFRNHEILHLILKQCLSDWTYTRKDFGILLREIEPWPYAMAFGGPLQVSDLQSESFLAYCSNVLESVISSLPRKDSRKWKGIPLVRELLEGDLSSDEESSVSFSTIPYEDEDNSVDLKPKFKGKGLDTKKHSNKELEVLKHRNQTVVTPIVGRISRNVYNGHQLVVAGELDSNEDDHQKNVTFASETPTHKFDPESIEWGNIVHKEDGTTYFESAILDGVEYTIGETVIVNPGSDKNRVRANNHESDAAQSTNIYGSSYWFCRLCYFFEDPEGDKWFHGQWFVHGCKTMLQETAHSQSLFMINECDNNPLSSIFKRCTVKMIVPEEEEVPEVYDEPDSTSFYCGLIWDEEATDFTDLPRLTDVEAALEGLLPHKGCYSCAIKRQQDILKEIRRIPGGYSYLGLRCHVHDYVYIVPRSHTSLLRIGQIVSIKGIPAEPKVVVRMFQRFDEVSWADADGGDMEPLSGLVKDERCLVRSQVMKTFHPHEIDGTCFVQYITDRDEIEKWVKHDDHFYFSSDSNGQTLLPVPPNSSHSCMVCVNDRMDEISKAGLVRLRNQALCGLELFAGAGGLGTGMDMSGWVETKYAVEFSPAAASTYSFNHPSTQVYCQDVNLLLKYIIGRDSGENPEYLPSEIGGLCTSLPKRGEVEFIFGGAPCQAFSGINHSRRADDIRSTLVCNMLSWVEHYQPSYFLLENVPGLLSFPLLAEQGESGKLLGGIVMGVVKFVQRTLIALGYQVRHKVLEAGQYGAPQGRQRVIFWGARRGIIIPDFPVPTHCYPKPAKFYKQPIGCPLRPATRSKDPDICHSFAPMRAITVNDAIGDLPPFDWKNPHNAITESAEDRQEAKHRISVLMIPSFSAVKGQPSWAGYVDPVEYPYLPMNRFQKWVRLPRAVTAVAGVHLDKVSLHYTAIFTSILVERTVNIPLKPLADHHSLPPELKLNDTRTKQYHAFFGRLDGNGHFRTAMTQMSPNIKDTYPLHPSQKRILTVRECARVQGFPDYYQMQSMNNTTSKIVNDQHRQIGNAVPLPLALALGNALGQAIVKTQLQKDREGSPVI